jgi:hypothetical protein
MRGFNPIIFAAFAAVAVSACQSTKTEPVDLGVGTQASVESTVESGTLPPADANAAAASETSTLANVEPGRISDVEVRAYCPSVRLREGTNFYRTYDKGAQDDPASVIYQAALGETTRSCTYNNGILGMTVAASGRIVPGPKGRAGTINMPIRVAVTRGDEVLYSKLHKQQVQISETGATQFVFTDAEVSFPQPTQRDITIFIGYDEGPYDTP